MKLFYLAQSLTRVDKDVKAIFGLTNRVSYNFQLFKVVRIPLQAFQGPNSKNTGDELIPRGGVVSNRSKTTRVRKISNIPTCVTFTLEHEDMLITMMGVIVSEMLRKNPMKCVQFQTPRPRKEEEKSSYLAKGREGWGLVLEQPQASYRRYALYASERMARTSVQAFIMKTTSTRSLFSVSSIL